jgi:hypothetical protein
MARKMHWRTGKACASRMTGLLCIRAGRRQTLGFLALLLLLLNAAVPYWHASQSLLSWGFAYAQPQAKHDASAQLECHHNSSGGPAQTDSAKGPLQKQGCPLCKALLLFSPGTASPGLAFVPCAPQAVIALVARPAERMTPSETRGKPRPRAPPFA